MSFPKRLEDVKLMPRDEIERRLAKIRRPGRGMHPKQGPGISHACIANFLGVSRQTIYSASYGRDCNGAQISNRTQLLMSNFFARYDAGEFSFFYHSRSGNKTGSGWWETIYHPVPKPQESTVGVVTVTEDGPKLGFAKMNRTWI